MRPPLPWRPSKLRLLVLAQRSPGVELVGVHRQAHAAAGLAPFEAGFVEDAVEPFGFGLLLHLPAAGHDHRVDVLGDVVAAHHGGRGAQVFDPAVGAGADEHAVERERLRSACPASRPMYSSALAAALRSVVVGEIGRDRARWPMTGATWPGFVPQVTCGAMSAASKTCDSVVLRAGIARQLLPARDGGVEISCGANSRPRR